MNRIFIFVFLIFVIILIFVFKPRKPELNINLVVSSIRNVSELAVVRYNYEKIVKFEKSPICKGTIVIKGDVEGFLDLSKIKKEDVKIRDSIVYINIPDVEMRFNLRDYRVFKELLLNCNRTEFLNSAIEKGRKIVIEDAKSKGIEEQTRERIKDILKNLIKDFGFKDVIFLMHQEVLTLQF